MSFHGTFLWTHFFANKAGERPLTSVYTQWRICTLRLPLYENDLQHTVHVKGFSLVCIRICSFSLQYVGNDFTQSEQANGFLTLSLPPTSGNFTISLPNISLPCFTEDPSLTNTLDVTINSRENSASISVVVTSWLLLTTTRTGVIWSDILLSKAGVRVHMVLLVSAGVKCSAQLWLWTKPVQRAKTGLYFVQRSVVSESRRISIPSQRPERGKETYIKVILRYNSYIIVIHKFFS